MTITRTMRACIAAALLMALLCVTGCAPQASSSSSESSDASSYPVTRETVGSIEYLSFEDGTAYYDGSSLLVELDENATTGYMWEAKSDISLLSTDMDISMPAEGATDSSNSSDSSDSSESGQPGTHVFSYTGLEEGTEVIDYTYSRSWESSSDDKSLVVTVTLGQNGAIQDVEITR